MQRMSTADAVEHWSAARQHSDIFTILCFDAPDTPIAMDAVVDELRERARGVEDLSIRVLNVPGDLDWPHWVRSDLGPDAFAVHSVRTWQDCLDRVGELIEDQLDPAQRTCRIHVFGPVTGAPRGCAADDGEAIVLALQMSHTVADGRGIAEICLGLFGAVQQKASARRDVGPDSGRTRLMHRRLAAAGLVRIPVSLGSAAWLGLRWLAEYRKAARRGPAIGWPAGVPLTELNRPPGRGRTLRAIVLDRRSLPTGHSVTVVALTAISYALDELLGPVFRRTAAVPVGIPPRPGSRNNYLNLPVDLYSGIDGVADRMARIAGELTAVQQRAAAPNPVLEAGLRAESALPAFMVHWATRRFDTGAIPEMVAGVTVVTSVNAESPDLPPVGSRPDLALAGGRVRFGAGFPYLAECMGLGHGVVGVGPVVTISVITSPDIVDADAYVGMLRRAFERVAAEGA